MPKQKSVRLPGHVIPIHYKLTIHPDMENFTFIGQELITVQLEKPDKKIVLHSRDLEILNGYYQIGKDEVEVAKITYDLKDETATVNFKKTLPKGKGKLYLEFRGVIAETLRGFYRSQYEHKGETKKIATTQFESTDARRAFPCFDEPAHKAVFELSLVIPKHLHAISNTIESDIPKEAVHDPNLKVVRFKPSPKMSTYLLAYIVGEFDSVQTKTKDGTAIRVFVPKGKKHQTKFALETTKRSLEFMNEYFAIKYPLPVLDIIAIPDFSAGAMENWGAVTFRETALLVDEEHTAFATKQRVAEVIAHELVHQWFGNLVTMEWWTHLWLNESFASFMANLVIDELFPEWNYWTRFVIDDGSRALELDALKNTHPIEVEVHHPDQIAEIFDAISYAKGATVLRMLHSYLGSTDFRDGLRHYLKKHSYKNTSSIHLWESFEHVSKKPVRKFMNNWVSKEGYPMIKVSELKNNKLQVEQSRFSFLKTNDKIIWSIPLQFQLTKDKVSDLVELTSKSKTVSVDSGAKFIKANPNETGFYRTLYSPPLLAKLYEPIKTKELNTIDRIGVIRDLFAMVKAGYLPTSAYLEFLQAYKNESSYTIWAEICSGMGEIYEIAQDNKKLQEQLAKYYLELLRPTLKLVGWEPSHNESNSRKLLRALIIGSAGGYGDANVLKKAKSIFANRGKKPISADMRAVIYTLAAKQGNQATFRELQKMYSSATIQEEQRRVGRAIMTFKDPKVFEKSLEFIFSNSVRMQDATLLIYLATANEYNRKEAWKWLKQNWKFIKEKYQKDHLLGWSVEGLGHFASAKMAKEVAEFFKKNPESSAERTIKQAVENITQKAAWIARDKGDIANCLKRLN